jgi:ubiquinol-cytochrome c reductase iron-sulfur subunit
VPAAADPIADPGLPAHLPRPTDVDPVAEKRAERQIAAFFTLSAVFAFLFCVSYFVFDIGDHTDTVLGLGTSNVTLGLCLGLALIMLGIGAIQWARKLMGDHEIVEYRHSAGSPPRTTRRRSRRSTSASRSPASAVGR